MHVCILCPTVGTYFPGSLTIRLYHPSLPVGLLDYILCPNRAGVDKFSLVDQHLPVHVKGFLRERRL